MTKKYFVLGCLGIWLLSLGSATASLKPVEQDEYLSLLNRRQNIFKDNQDQLKNEFSKVNLQKKSRSFTKFFMSTTKNWKS